MLETICLNYKRLEYNFNLVGSRFHALMNSSSPTAIAKAFSISAKCPVFIRFHAKVKLRDNGVPGRPLPSVISLDIPVLDAWQSFGSLYEFDNMQQLRLIRFTPSCFTTIHNNDLIYHDLSNISQSDFVLCLPEEPGQEYRASAAVNSVRQ